MFIILLGIQIVGALFTIIFYTEENKWNRLTPAVAMTEPLLKDTAQKKE
jgi:hypothetical protein